MGTEARSQVNYSNISNSVIYSTDFMQSTNSTGSSYNYTPMENGGTVYQSGTVSNNYGVNSVSRNGVWAVYASGQDGWTNFGVPNGNGPGVIYYNKSAGYSNRPAGLSIAADEWYSTDQANGNYGTYPQSATTYLAQNLYSATGNNAIHFDSTFWLYASAANNNNQWDTLGWTLMNSSQQALLSINLDATDSSGSSWQLSATAAGSTTKQALNISAAGWSTLSGNSITHLGFNILNVGQTNESVQVLQYQNVSTTNIPTIATQGAYSILGTTQIVGGENASSLSGGSNVGILANTWTLADTSSTDTYTNTDGSISTIYTDFAQNNLMMQSLLISIPEPKTWVLFGISALIMVVALRRKTS